MKLLVMSAMEEELDHLLAAFEADHIDDINESKLYLKMINGHQVYFLNSQIGKVNAAITTSMFLNDYQVDLLMSIGTSGSISDQLEIGDFVIGTKLAYHDVNVTNFGYDYGQLPQMNKYFIPDYNQEISEIIKKTLGSKAHEGLILTGDKFINSVEDKQALTTLFDNPLCVEMESTAIVHTAIRYKQPTIVLRTISDKANGEATANFNEFVKLVCYNYIEIINAICSESHE